MATHRLVTIIDDDESVRESLPDLVKLLGYSAEAFDSARAFLASESLTRSRCLILDIQMPEMSGPELVAELRRNDLTIPVIFITAHREEAMRPNVSAQGAVATLFKPFSETALVGALETAFRKDN
jgi:FixJ family two-component response regulator